MKKVFFAFAIAGMFGFAACNNNNATEENTDTMPVVVETPDTTNVEAAADSNAVENAAEETATEATTEANAQ